MSNDGYKPASQMSPYVQAQAISTGADILGSAFGGGNSIGRQAKNQERLQNVRSKYDKRVNKQTLKLDKRMRLRDKKTTAYDYATYQSKQAQVRDAKNAGLHPLFAMGATGNQAISGGAARQSSSSGNAPRGQSDSGSFARDGLKAISGHFDAISQVEASKELAMAQAQASALRIAENNISNDQLTDSENIVLGKNTTLATRSGVSSIKQIEDVYGEVADIVGGVRFVEDLVSQSTVPSITKVYNETIRWLRGKTGIKVTAKIRRLQAKQKLLTGKTKPAFRGRKSFLGK